MTGFDWVLSGFYWVYMKFHWVLLGFAGFYWVLLGFTGFYWVLLGFVTSGWVGSAGSQPSLVRVGAETVDRRGKRTAPLDWTP